MSRSPQCQIPSFVEIGPPVPEKKIFKGFEHFWAWRPSWSCDLDHLYKLSFPLPKEAPHKIWLWLAKRFQRRRRLKMWTDDGRRRRRTAGRRTHGYTISSPCEPEGSGELKKQTINQVKWNSCSGLLQSTPPSQVVWSEQCCHMTTTRWPINICHSLKCFFNLY